MQLTASRLRVGEEVSDAEFDRAYPPRVRFVSFRHWTPVRVASRAANLLVGAGATRVLDIGAGPGKFCIVGALTTSAHFTGIEQRPNLVELAENTALQFGVSCTRFVHANVVDFDCGSFDGLYLYNPFQEQVNDDLFPIDEVLGRSRTRYKMYLASTTAHLIRAPFGTSVVTYNGFGAAMPRQYRRVHREEIGGADLVLWSRTG